MAKRIIPLFVFDLTRRHKLGECDFVACTDYDNGFVAKIDYVEGDVKKTDVNTRIGNYNGGVSLRIEIRRYTGRNIEPSKVKTLMALAEKRYIDMVQRKIDIGDPTVAECIEFIHTIVRANRHYIDETAGDFEGRQTALMSCAMLERCAEYLSRLT